MDSREELNRRWQAAEGKDRWRLTNKEITAEKLSLICRTESFLEEEKLLVLEGFFQLAATFRKILAEIVKKANFEVILWEKKKVNMLWVKPLGKMEIKEFKLAKSLFTFLEAIRVGQAAEAIRLLRKVLSEEEAEMVLAMIERQMRMMIVVKSGGLKSIPEWQRRKFSGQANGFSEEKLAAMYADLVRLDYKRKTDKMAEGLSGLLDLWLYDHLV